MLPSSIVSFTIADEDAIYWSEYMKPLIVRSAPHSNGLPGPDCVLFTPPFTPSDSEPPLGPAILRGQALIAGYDVQPVDGNIRYLNLFREEHKVTTSVIGDQDKDRITNSLARDHFPPGPLVL